MDENILIVDDDPAVRDLMTSQIEYLGFSCHSASDAEEALERVGSGGGVPLVLTDVHMPGVSGIQLLRRLKALDPNIQVVMVTGLHDLDTVRECLREGAYDYLTKPAELADLGNVVQRAVERNHLMRENELYRRELEAMVHEKTREVRQTRDMALMTLAKLAESRDNETGLHLERMAAYSLRIAQQLDQSTYRDLVNQEFIDQLGKSSPLHDIGKVGISDSILLKAGPLTNEEFRIMQTHTTIGGDTLRSVIEQYQPHGFLVMAMEIAYSHHERWDGSGYPAGLAGADIPLAARVVALADAYDAITSQRPYKTACAHEEALRRIQADGGRHFDPVIVETFLTCHRDFQTIQQRLEDRQAPPHVAAGGPA